eukprot:2947007-Lingulodinium_polyedra.AAC.1
MSPTTSHCTARSWRSKPKASPRRNVRQPRRSKAAARFESAAPAKISTNSKMMPSERARGGPLNSAAAARGSRTPSSVR